MKRFAGIALLFILVMPGYCQIPYFQHYYLQRKNEPLQINTIFQDKNGFMWFGTDKGLFRFNGLRYKRFTLADSLRDENVTAIAEDSLGRIWIGYHNGNLSYLEKGRVKTFEPPEGFPSQAISDIHFDKQGNLWLATLNDGLYYFKKGRLYRLDENEGMPDLFVYNIAEDNEGNVWAGTDGGLVRCSLTTEGDVTINVINYDDGLPDNIVKKVVPGENHILWLGTEDAGILRYNTVTNAVTPVIPQSSSGSISDFLIAGHKAWISSRQSGLMVYNLDSKKSKSYNMGAGAGFAYINVLFHDIEDNIWIGSRTGLMRTQGDYIEYIDSFEPTDDKNILAVTADHSGDVWFSNKDGLFKRHIDGSGKGTTQKQLLHTAFEKYIVISLYTDSKGYVWAGLYGEGVLRIDPENGHVQYLGKELRNGNILNITGKGNKVWLATLGGTVCIDISENKMTVKNYSSDDGLASDFIYQVFIDSRDRVWFGTDGKGAVMMDDNGFHHFQRELKSKVVYGFAEDKRGTIWANIQGEGLYYLQDTSFHAAGTSIAVRDNNISCLTADNFGNLVVMHDAGIDIYDVDGKNIQYLGEEVGLRDKIPNLNAVVKDTSNHILFGTDEGIVRYTPVDITIRPRPQPYIEELRVHDHPVDLDAGVRLSHDENNLMIHFLGLWYRNPVNLNFQYKLENYNDEWINSHDFSVTYSSLPPGAYTFRLRSSDTQDFSDAKEATFVFVIRPPFWKTRGFYFISAVMVIVLGYGFIKFRERRLQEDNRILEQKVEERTFEIQRQKEEIQAQNEEILSQAEEIKGINENLEMIVKERTSELERKNKALEEYAFINAHQLRAPLASILGLINLINKSELGNEEKEIIGHLEEAAEKLETIVRDITIAIEKGDHKRKY